MALFVSNGLFALPCLARPGSKKRGPPIGGGARGGQSDVPSRPGEAARRTGHEHRDGTPCTQSKVQCPKSKVRTETGARGKIPRRDGTRCFIGCNPEKSALTPALSHRNGRAAVFLFKS